MKIFPISDIPGVKDGTWYEGYYIMFPIDIRSIAENQEKELYKARVFTTSSLLVELRSMPFKFQSKRDDFHSEFQQQGLGHIMDGLDNALHKYEAEKTTRDFIYLILEFPSDHELSPKEIFSEAGDDHDLEMHLVPHNVCQDAFMNSYLTDHWVV